MDIYIFTTHENDVDQNLVNNLVTKNNKLLFIATRSGQLERVKKSYPNHTCIGWWDIFNDKIFLDFDIIIFLDPNRASDKLSYIDLIARVSKLDKPFKAVIN